MLYFKFENEVHGYQKFVSNNIKSLGNYVTIAEQLYIKGYSNNFIDILALDINAKRLVILELKNVKAKNDVIGQPIKYYDLIIQGKEQIVELLENNSNKIPYDIDEITLLPKIMLIVPDFDSQIVRTFSYINGLDISIVKFNAIQKTGYYEIIKETYEPSKEKDIKVVINTDKKVEWDFNEYTSKHLDHNKIKLAKETCNFIKSLSKDNVKFFFYENRIAIKKEKKIVANINLGSITSSNLTFSINTKNIKTINMNDVMYDGNIIEYKNLNSGIKFKYSRIPTKLFKKMFN